MNDYVWALLKLRSVFESRNIPLPNVVLVDRCLALLNALDVVFPTVPVLLCMWHVVKAVESHARKNSFPDIIDVTRSSPRNPVWIDSPQLLEFCDAFNWMISSPEIEIFEERRRHLYDLSSVEAEYVDRVWLREWKENLVKCWTKSIRHYGLQTTSRVEGYHAALKRWLSSSRGDLLTLFTIMTHWWLQSVQSYRRLVSDAAIRKLASLRNPLYAHVVRVIHNHALLECNKQLEIVNNAPCTQTYEKITGLPCGHKLRKLQADEGHLTSADFDRHWWIDRNAAVYPDGEEETTDPPIETMVLDPQTSAERRSEIAQRGRNSRSASHQSGRGISGTRRLPSAFERSEQSNRPLPAMHTSLIRNRQSRYHIAPIRFHPYKE